MVLIKGLFTWDQLANCWPVSRPRCIHQSPPASNNGGCFNRQSRIRYVGRVTRRPGRKIFKVEKTEAVHVPVQPKAQDFVHHILHRFAGVVEIWRGAGLQVKVVLLAQRGPTPCRCLSVVTIFLSNRKKKSNELKFNNFFNQKWKIKNEIFLKFF